MLISGVTQEAVNKLATILSEANVTGGLELIWGPDIPLIDITMCGIPDYSGFDEAISKIRTF